MVKIERKRGARHIHHCGASLLNDKFVLTAAHCLENVDTSTLYLLLGVDDISIEPSDQFYRKERKIVRSFIHPDYDTNHVYYDIALIEMDQAVEFDAGVHPICLPEEATRDVDKRRNDLATLTGWGTSSRSDEEASSKLRVTQLSIFSQSYCNQSYNTDGFIGDRIRNNLPKLFQSSIFCAGYEVGFMVVKAG